MITPADNLLGWMAQLLLILTRVSAMFVLTPILGRGSIPAMVKIGFSLLMAFMLISFYPPPEVYPYQTVLALSMAVLLELVVGFVIGFMTLLFFSLVYTAGQVIDMQIGFTMAQMFDQTTNSQMPITGNLLNIVMIQCFLAAGGLGILFGTVVRTFEVIPIGGAVLPQLIAPTVVGFFAKSFVLSLNVAMPVLASALLAEVGLGLIVRTAPQMNVFVVGIPIKVILGLVMLAITIPMFVSATGPIFERMYEAIDAVTGVMIPT